MNKPTPDSSNPIERLLQDRAQFVSWLTRLNSSGDAGQAVPEAVRGRVRADYERRLEAVLDELRGHTSALEEQVDVLSARAKELAYRESQHKEQLAEAEVRHVVGEYDDVKWEGIRAELLKLVSLIRDELNHTIAEIDRLNEVLGTIRAPLAGSGRSARATVARHFRTASRAEYPGAGGTQHHAHRARPGPCPGAEPSASAGSGPERNCSSGPLRTLGHQRNPPRCRRRRRLRRKTSSGRTLWFPTGKPDQAGGGTSGKLDELAFLKSVTGGEATPPSAPAAPASPPQRPRPSGGFKATEVPAAPPIHPPAPAPVAGPAHAPPPPRRPNRWRCGRRSR